MAIPEVANRAIDLLSQGIIYNDTPSDKQIVGYQNQGISLKWTKVFLPIVYAFQS